MTFLGRTPRSYLRNISQLHMYVWYCLKSVLLFKDPVFVLYHYFTSRPPSKKVVELRSGLQVYLSDHPADLITTFLVFVKEDYGKVRPGSTVIDIGANIGAFSLYAAYCGATKVLSFEPNAEAYRQLQRNIAENHLESTITPRQLFVGSGAGNTVRFPVAASPYNAALPDDDPTDSEQVQTTDLPGILADNHLGRVNLLKLDCEGSEYDIVPGTDSSVWRKIQAVRMEFHRGDPSVLANTLEANGFHLQVLRQDTLETGSMWFRRTLRK